MDDPSKWRIPRNATHPAALDTEAAQPRAGAEGEGGSASAEPSETEDPARPRGRTRGRRHSPAEQRALLAEQEASGASDEAFAAAHDITPTTLATWRRKAQRTQKQKRPRFTPEERRAAVEAFVKSGRTREDFARLWGCSSSSLDNWLRRYRAEGPRSLETKPSGKSGPRPNARRIPDAVRERIVELAREHEGHGVTRIANHLLRFESVRVSPGTVRNVLRAAGISGQPYGKGRSRPKRHLPRRFERARPGELWQSDITSFVLRREGRRVYLTVFLDDHSRYVVAWALATHQRTPLVTEPLLEGIARFGKPREVLTDQGRQYFAWRGKSGFQKLLAKEGIQHVVSRAHHPETLGKCERLWKTVGEEFWERAAPQDIDDARRRLAHWLKHYNHFRPHQGIDGLVPADRFFGAESEVRAALERELAENELRLALEEAPRRGVYLTGRIGSQRISLHGERGRLLVSTPDGGEQELSMDELGIEREEETSDGARGDERAETRGTDAEGGGERLPSAAAAQANEPQTDGVPQGAASGVAGAGPVGGGAAGAAGTGARDVHADPLVLAGEEEQAGGGERAGGEAAAGVAAESAGAVGHAGGSAAATAQAGGPQAVRGEAGGDAGGAEAPHREARGGAGADGGPGAGAANGPVGAAEHGVVPGRRDEPWTEAEEVAQGCHESCANESARSSARGRRRRRSWLSWLKRSE